MEGVKKKVVRNINVFVKKTVFEYKKYIDVICSKLKRWFVNKMGNYYKW